MNHDYPACAVSVRMRVLFRGPAMRRPSCVSDAVGSVERLKPNRFFQIPEFALCPPDFQMAPLINNGYAGRIVAAVFKLTQTVKDYRHNLFVPNISNNATHK